MKFPLVSFCAGLLVVVQAMVGGTSSDRETPDKPGERPSASAAGFVAPTTKLDFFRGGSQPGNQYEQILHSMNCGACHGSNNAEILINKPWEGSMHGLSARDPLMLACLTVTEQDAPFVGDMCIRCHAPRAWISGRSTPTDGSAINLSDRDGINCQFCHRMVDPFYEPGVSPVEDAQILDNIVELPVANGSGSFVLDPLDRRRSTRGTPSTHTAVLSPFHNDSRICETCHDVGNPTLDRQPDGTYVGNAFGLPHPTGERYDMFPLERTFSEWVVSEFATTGVDMGGRFGGNKAVVSTCQDCHMPDSTSRAAEGGPIRHDMADHGMYGGGTWIPLVVALLYPDEVDEQAMLASVEGSRSMLQRAATMTLTQQGDAIDVRVINETGHKLPTGQAEGRQMWINVQFFDGDGQMIAERGAYDTQTATPATDDTEMYELVLGMDEPTAKAVGLPVGPTHHIAFCNKIYQDNRIPPRGFTNAAFEEIQSPVVGVAYADGQYWDDRRYVLPTGTATVTASLYYKTASTEFITYLRDANHTDDSGQVLYDAWEKTGKSPPVLMVSETMELAPFATGDFSGDGVVNLDDCDALMGCVTGPDGGPRPTECAPADLDADGDVDLLDLGRFQGRFGN